MTTTRRRFHPWLLAGFVAASLALPTPVEAQVGTCFDGFDWSLTPMLVRNDQDEARPGGRLDAALCTSGHDLRRTAGGTTEPFPFSYHVEGTAGLLAVPSGEWVPQQTALGGRAGVSLSLSGPGPVVECTPEMTDEECEQAMASAGRGGFDYGFVYAMVHGRWESSAGWDEQNVLGGVELRYAHLKPYIPSVVFSWDRVAPVASEVRDALTLEEEAFSRWMLRGYWVLPLGRMHAELEGAVFRADGLDSLLEEAGWDSGEYLAAALAFDWMRPLGPVVVESIRLQYADGDLPTAGTARQAWSLGIALGPGG